MDFRIVPPQKRQPNKYDNHVTYAIPVKVIKIDISKDEKIHSIIFERVDFVTGETKISLGITFDPTLKTFADHDKKIPFYTNAIAFKQENLIAFKIIGVYNAGLVQKIYSVKNNILDADESQIMDVFKHYYKGINEWVGHMDSNACDL